MNAVSVLQHDAFYARESLAAARASGVDRLLELHWREIAHYQDIPLEIDWPVYEAAEKAGKLYVYTARIEGELIGYSCHFVGPNPHYKSSIQAVQDVLYVEPVHRRGSVGFRLIRFADRDLKAAGVQISYQHSKVAQPIGALLERLDYEAIDTIYGKRLDL